jgi:hypothetical protein
MRWKVGDIHKGYIKDLDNGEDKISVEFEVMERCRNGSQYHWYVYVQGATLNGTWGMREEWEYTEPLKLRSRWEIIFEEINE